MSEIIPLFELQNRSRCFISLYNSDCNVHSCRDTSVLLPYHVWLRSCLDSCSEEKWSHYLSMTMPSASLHLHTLFCIMFQSDPSRYTFYIFVKSRADFCCAVHSLAVLTALLVLTACVSPHSFISHMLCALLSDLLTLALKVDGLLQR